MCNSHKTRTMVSLGTLLIYIFLAFGSVDTETEVTMDTVDEAKDGLRTALASVKIYADETTVEVDSAYIQLKQFLDERSLTDANLRILESRLDTVRTKYALLQSTFNDSKGKKLFRMLKRRAKENTSQNLREKMLRDIADKQMVFQSKIAPAEKLIEKIGQSVQKYDDIVGYCQVNRDLEGVDGIIDDIESIMQAGTQLNDEIRVYVNEGLRIIEDI